MPIRIQRKRTKGWRMPPGTVYVGRPTFYGNPWGITPVQTAARVVEMYRLWLGYSNPDPIEDKDRLLIVNSLHHLRGRDLACWCRLDQPCHADVLIDLANR